MFRKYLCGLVVVSAAAFFMTTIRTQPAAAANEETSAAAVNPLTQPWTGPYGGVPPFDKVKIADFKPALETAMAENLKEIDAIATNKAAPTFANTFVPLEKSGEMLSRVSRIFGVWSTSMNTDEFQPVQAEMQPKLAAHYDKITQNTALFKRIETVYKTPSYSKLNVEQQRLVKVHYENFVHAGAALDDAKKARLSEINQQLGTSTQNDVTTASLLDQRDKAIALQSEEVYQRYMKYLTGCADMFRKGYIDVNQFTLQK